MKKIQIKDKTFDLCVSEKDILDAVNGIAMKISQDLADKNPLFLCVLNGAFMFASDLLKSIDFPCEVSFVKLSSYQGLKSTGIVKQLIGLEMEVKNRVVVVVEDIVDTGITMEGIIQSLHQQGATEVRLAVFLNKPEALKRKIYIDYPAMVIPDDFVVGYGLDYEGYGRNLRDLYVLSN